MTHVEVERREAPRVRAAATVLECFAVPIFLLSGDGEVIECNAAAREVCRQGQVLRLERGRLRAVDRELEEHLEAALRFSAATVVCAGAPSRARARLLVRPIVRDLRDRETRTAVFLLRAVRHDLSATLLGETYAFTPRESEIASALLDGRSLSEIASALHLSIHTVRTHIRSVLEKTGTKTQRDLVRVLALELGPMRFE